MKIEGYEEITYEEYEKIPRSEVLYIYNGETGKFIYFKKNQEFPIDYSIKQGRCMIQETGEVRYYDTYGDQVFSITADRLENAEQMIKIAKEIRDKKKIKEFPIVFESDNKKIEIFKENTRVCDKDINMDFVFNKDISEPLLIKALEKLKEVRK